MMISRSKPYGFVGLVHVRQPNEANILPSALAARLSFSPPPPLRVPSASPLYLPARGAVPCRTVPRRFVSCLVLFFATPTPQPQLQESPEVVPTGEMPRNIIVVLDRNLVDKVSPGTRVSIMGIASLYNSAAAKKQVGGVAIRTPFMQVS